MSYIHSAKRVYSSVYPKVAFFIFQADLTMDMDNVDTVKFLNDIAQRSGT